MNDSTAIQSRRIGFISTRIAGTDGVSLEVGKWAEILEDMGHECFYIAGQLDRPKGQCRVIEEAHFKHPMVSQINRRCFGKSVRNADLSADIHELTWIIKEKLQSAMRSLELDTLIAENCLTIPMNIPLGLAVVETVMETGIGCIAHHHDFAWERERYLVNAVDDCMSAAFPPSLLQMQHVVINSQAAREFSRRTGLPCRVIPNIMDFDNPPDPADEYSLSFRDAVGLARKDLMFLQPTRLVQRKGIEHAVELLHQLDDRRCNLVISHASGDEGDMYAERIRKYAKALKVPLILADERMGAHRGTRPDGQRLYTIVDAYHCSDFVTYPSTYEGFGNAFLETIYYKKPILCNRYAIYRTDIEPCGFDVILMDGFLTDDVVSQVRCVLGDKQRCEAMVERNYEVGRQFFSYRRAADELRAILAKPHLAPPATDGSE